ncbi:MAG TPA: response regulator [Bacteroidota bacterium]|nr:response regulator [Bacteroidota bacterium]
MTEAGPIRILLVEDNRDFANLVEVFLRKYDRGQFEIVWRESGMAALDELATGALFDIILMDYFLPGQNGLETTKALQARGVTIPVVFLTVNKDFDLAVQVLKLGVEDYLVKDEISTPVLPRTVLNVIERKKLRDQLTSLEISQQRLETIQGMVPSIAQEIRKPLDEIRVATEGLAAAHAGDGMTTYLAIIRDNLARIEKKLSQLKEMKTDKTVPYIKDIRMLDLSDS